MRGLLAVLLLALCTPALAQEPPPDPADAGLAAQLHTLAVLIDRAVARDPDSLEAQPLDAAVDRFSEGVVRLARSGGPAEDLRAHRSTLVAARTHQLTTLLVEGRASRALERGDSLLASLATLRSVLGADAELDAVRKALIRAAQGAGDPDRMRRWAEACANDCAEPETRAWARAAWMGEGLDALETGGEITGHGAMRADDPSSDDGRGMLRWRVGIGWTVPTPQLASDGSTVRPHPLGGVLTLAWAPSVAGCVEASAGWDLWQVEGGLAQRRIRAELGWCPSLLVARRGPVTAALRLGVGLGVATGSVVYDGSRDQRFIGVGPHVRAELPVRLGPVELGPRVGLAPYGGAGQPFARRAFVGLAVSLGRPPEASGSQ